MTLKMDTRSSRALGIILNDRCGLSCKHCSLGYDGNYRGTGWKIEESELRKVIREIDPNRYQGVIMAGGEPALAPELLLAGIEACREKHISSAVVTAPIWARTAKSASDFFRRMHGLDIVMLSYDVFHLEFITVDHYLNAIIEAHAAGVFVFVNLCYANLEEKADLLKRIESVRELIDHFQYQPVLPFGNAAANEASIGLEKREIHHPDDLAALPRSCVAGNSLLNRDGHFYACCWAAKVDNSPLKFPHFRQLGFGFSCMLMEQDPAFQAVRTAGFIGSLSPVTAGRVVELVRGESFVNECDLCVRLMREGNGVTWKTLVQLTPEKQMSIAKA
jgi:Radical SAM superfamily/4Fe-4S single cluster domain